MGPKGAALCASQTPGSEAEAVLAGYRAQLERSALAPATRRVYQRHARGFLSWLPSHPEHCEALADPHARDFACRDYVACRREAGLSPASIASVVAGLGDLFRYLGVGPPIGLKRPRP